MPAPRYLALVGGFIKNIVASVVGGTPFTIVSTGSDGFIDRSYLKDQVTKSMVASENIAAGDQVNIWDDAGTPKLRKADASGGLAKKSDGYAPAAILSGASGLIVSGQEINTAVAGLTPVADYFLSATVPGGVAKATDPGYPTTAGHISQFIGKSTAAAELMQIIDQPIELA